MLPTFCRPTIEAICLEFCGKLAVDGFLGACCRKAMAPEKLWTLLSPHIRGTKPDEPLRKPTLQSPKASTYGGKAGLEQYGRLDGRA